MSDMCTDNHMVSYSSFSDNKDKEYKSYKELSQTKEGREYLYDNRCRICQHLRRCGYL